jgi:RNA polymerase sigma-70 factor (ECF subfamily)
MFDNKNLYTLRTEIVEGITHYFVSFKDGQDIHREIEVSRPVYTEFLRFVKAERNLHRWSERHLEQSELTDETLCERAFHQPKSVEDTVFDSIRNRRLRQTVLDLPEIQRRRFILYYEFGLTYVQIARTENCSAKAVEHSVEIARKKIKKYFEE